MLKKGSTGGGNHRPTEHPVHRLVDSLRNQLTTRQRGHRPYQGTQMPRQDHSSTISAFSPLFPIFSMP